MRNQIISSLKPNELLNLMGVILVALFLVTGMGCRQDSTLNKSETSGGQTDGGTGTGEMIDKADQKKLPINPDDYKPMPMPNPEDQPPAKEGPDAEKPSVQASDAGEKIKEDDKKNSD